MSMYQTVVTNLNLQGDGNIPITMSAIAANSNQLGDGTNEDDNDDVKCVLNGGQASIRIATSGDGN